MMKVLDDTKMKTKMLETNKKDQLYDHLRSDIRFGNYSPGHRFPPEVDLARQLGISRNTLRSALLKLEEENLVVRIKSKGTFVAPYHDKPLSERRLLVLNRLESHRSYPHHYILPSLLKEAMVRGYEVENYNFDIFKNYTAGQLRKFISENEFVGVVIVISSFNGDENIIGTMNSLDIPVVLSHGNFRDYQLTGWATTYSDFRASWEVAVRHLAEQGHRRIVTTNLVYPNRNVRHWARQEYLELLESLRIASDENLIIDMEFYGYDYLEKRLKEIFSLRDEMPTAVLCYSDFMAPTVYNVLNELELRIPQDVAVMGYCGAPDSKFMSPPLSTVDLNYQEIGRKTIEIMDTAGQWFDPEHTGRKAPPLVKNPFKLEVRGSTNVRRFEYQLETK